MDANSSSSFSRVPLCSHLLQQCLRSFCTDTRWIYAVFWRILPRNFPPPKWELGGYLDRTKANKRNWILVWEDGFCDFSRTTNGRVSAFQPDIFFKMSHEVYNYGEGLMGKISSESGHKWVFKDPSQSDQTPSWQSSIDPQPRIWEAQFKSGIQTIAVISVCEGSVQLGSIEKIPEDLEFVALLQNKFNSLLVNLPEFSSTRIAGKDLLLKTDYKDERIYTSNLERQLSWNEDNSLQKQIVPWSGGTVSTMNNTDAWQAPKSCHIRSNSTTNMISNADYHTRVMPSMNSLETLMTMLPSVTSSPSSQVSVRSQHITAKNICYIGNVTLEQTSPADLHRTASPPITSDYWLQEPVSLSDTPTSPLLPIQPQHHLPQHIILGPDSTFRVSDCNQNLGDCSYFGDSIG